MLNKFTAKSCILLKTLIFGVIFLALFARLIAMAFAKRPLCGNARLIAMAQAPAVGDRFFPSI
jgi:hypothetical protein